ncbi:Profilin [Fusarium falciforme]|nr:Profilin [Fusarium falciforme]WAO85462.1 Profilin [Fusarium falciforme]
MSWQAVLIPTEYRVDADLYQHNSLVATGHIDKGAIISVAGDSAWAHSPDFQLKPEEMKAISSIVSEDKAAIDKAFGEGLYIGGERYVLTRVEGRSLYARAGRLGVAVAKTTQAIVVGHHGEAQVAGNATSTVEALADYLIGQGY